MNSNSVEATILDNRRVLLGYINRKVGDPELAEDILHDSLLKTLRASSGLREEEKLLPWFYRIVDNAITDLFRRRQVERNYLAELADRDEEWTEPEEQKAICHCFKQIIPDMKPEYARLIDEIDLRGGDPGEVAARLGITKNNLKVRLHRARTQLRERLETMCRACATHGCLDCSCGGH